MDPIALCKSRPGAEIDIGCSDNSRVCEELFGPEWGQWNRSSSECGDSVPSVRCQKQAYLAKPIDCCNSTTGCIDKLSCDPSLYIGSTPCNDFTINTCNTSQSWANNRQFCNDTYGRIDASTRQQIFNGIFSAGIRQPGSRNVAQSDIYDMCRRNPSICEADLYRFCANYTLNDVSANRNVAELCGCYLTNADIYEYSAIGIGRECIPPCTNLDTVKLVDRPCMSGICVIDDVAINLNRARGGDIDITQTCGNCSGAATCRCDIYNVNIDITDAEFEDINLSQHCVGNARCIDGRTGLEIPCIDGTENVGQNELTTYQIISWISISALTILVVFFLFFLVLRVYMAQ